MTFVKTAALSLVLAMGTAIPHVAMAQQSANGIQAACETNICAPTVIGLFNQYNTGPEAVDNATRQVTAEVAVLANGALNAADTILVDSYVEALEQLLLAAESKSANDETIAILKKVIEALKARKGIDLEAFNTASIDMIPKEASPF